MDTDHAQKFCTVIRMPDYISVFEQSTWYFCMYLRKSEQNVKTLYKIAFWT